MEDPSAPQYIFTVRHGARLDAADPSWHLTSATPYDPPLTYGGWLQARSLGQRIANILSSRSTSPADSSSNLASKPKQTRIVIHSSPFLRCVQTSIAISAGISMYWGQQQMQDGSTDNPSPKREYIKPLLRVDAWLGEWLTPDYFTEVSPPPEMALLAATSKAELMRPSSAHAIRRSPPSNILQSPQSPLSTLSKDLASSLPAAAFVGYTPPLPGYAISPNGPIPRGHVSHAKEYIDIDYPWDSTKFGMGGEYGEEWSIMHKRFRRGYKQMLNWFSTTNADITATKTVWGKPGGKRLSTTGQIEGVDGLNGVPSSQEAADIFSSEQQDGASDEAVETVVILVTHGAGCNALIGAMTDKPVLMDIGIASMTMAERTNTSKALNPKPPVKTTYSTGIIPPPAICPVESAELNITYDVKVMASTEHLRRGSMAAIMNPTAGNSPKLVGRDSPSLSALRNRPMSGSGNSPFGGWSISGGTGGLGSPLLPLTENSFEDSIRGPVLHRRSSVASTVSSTGLWSRPVTAAGPTNAEDIPPSAPEVGLTRSNSGKHFIDRERDHRAREQQERSVSVRLMASTTESGDGDEGDDGEQAAGSEESDSGRDEHGTWAERKRRWTMDQANRKGPM